jgi:predicted phosphodiesterase
MTQDQLAFISSWPERIEMHSGSFKFLFLHGSPEDPLNGYIYEDSQLKDHPDYSEYRLIFVGNTHIPFIRQFGRSVIINVGSVGLPRDHGKVGSIALLNLAESTVKIIRYSIAEIQDEIRQIYGRGIDDRVKQVFDRVAHYNVVEEFSFG